MERSYSAKACPWDNACIESFHSLIKREWLSRFRITDYSHVYRLVFEYIEAFYNTVRIVFRRRKGRFTEESKSGAIGRNKTIIRRSPVKGIRQEIEMPENHFQGFGSEFCALLVESGSSRGLWVQVKEIKQFVF